MKRILLFTLIQMISCYGLIGQERTIEIEVSDTISVLPDQIIYMFSLSGEDEFSFDFSEEGNSISREELEEVINNYPEIDLIKEESNVLRSNMFESLLSTTLIKASSKNTVEDLLKELEEYSNLSGSVIETIVYNSESSELKLKNKLLKLAEYRAQQTTQLLNRELGAIISIVEYDFIDLENKARGDVSYPPLSQLAQLFGSSAQVNDSKIYYQKMKIVYELK